MGDKMLTMDSDIEKSDLSTMDERVLIRGKGVEGAKESKRELQWNRAKKSPKIRTNRN